MKIRAERKALADAIGWVAQAIPKRPQMPALAGMRLSAHGGQLTARAFDYDISHTAVVDVDVASEGECLVSGSFLSWIVGSIKGETVELVLDGDEVTVSSGRSTYRARTLRLDDFPSLPEQPNKVGSVDAGDLADIVAAARLFIDNDASLAVIQGVHLEGDATELTAVGLRSAGGNVARAPWQCAKPFEANPLPGSLETALKGLVGEVTVGCEGGVLGLADGRRSVTLRTLDGEYPKWRNTLREPHEDMFQVTVELEDLVDAVRRAGALCDDTTPLALTFGADEIQVEIAAGERGGGTDLVAAERHGGEDAVLGMHSRFLLAGLGAMPPGPVQLGVGHKSKGLRQQVVIRPLDASGRTSLVMPKNLPGGAQ